MHVVNLPRASGSGFFVSLTSLKLKGVRRDDATSSRVLGALLCVAAVHARRRRRSGDERGADAADYVRVAAERRWRLPGLRPASSTPSATIDAVLRFRRAGVDPKTVENGGNGPDDYLATQAATFSASSPGGAAKLVAGLAAMDLDETNFGGIDPFATMEANYNAGTGKYGVDAFAQTLFMIAERSAGAAVPSAATAYLASLQLPDGGVGVLLRLRRRHQHDVARDPRAARGGMPASIR